MRDIFLHDWHIFAGFFTLVIAVVATCHVVLNKRDSRAALLWVGVIWLVPAGGAILYLLFGINRIRRRAATLRSYDRSYTTPPGPAGKPAVAPVDCPFSPELGHYNSLANLVRKITARPLLPGNTIEPLLNGDQAFPAMLESIDSAGRSIALATYIFDHDASGQKFVEALDRAVRRGVQTRVLIDDAGSRYSSPTVLGALRERGIPVAVFMPSSVPAFLTDLNLRNHRKILVTDGRAGFIGGLNIRHGNMLSENPRVPIQDLHFRLEGPVVAQLQETFAEDWLFTTKERLDGEAWFPPLTARGEVTAREISDGPDEDFEKLRWTLLGAIATAQRSIKVLTPYFLPDAAMITALTVAAMRGVEVDIVLPANNNLKVVQWATFGILWQILYGGCRVWLMPGVFDHSKLMLVDDCWSLIGSANWDPRSLRLNFEVNVESYDKELASRLAAILQDKLSRATRVTNATLEARSLPIRLRDGVARLLTPYL
jgi:cardiolipin synthase